LHCVFDDPKAVDDAGSDGFSAVDISGAQLKPYRLGMGIMVMTRPGPRCL